MLIVWIDPILSLKGRIVVLVYLNCKIPADDLARLVTFFCSHCFQSKRLVTELLSHRWPREGKRSCRM